MSKHEILKVQPLEKERCFITIVTVIVLLMKDKYEIQAF